MVNDFEILTALIAKNKTQLEIAEITGWSESQTKRRCKKYAVQTQRYKEKLSKQIHRGTKVCTECKIEKPKTSFHKDKKGLGGLHSKCAGCKYVIGLIRINKNRHFIIDYKKKSVCSMCGYDDWRAFDFHHCRGKKLFNISNASKKHIDKIILEMEKCDVLCANCHRIVTHEEREAKKKKRRAVG